MNAIRFIIKEHLDNRETIIRLAIAHMGKQTLRTSLGAAWVYIHDFVYFLMFVLFRTLMSGNGQIEGMSQSFFLLTGLVPWFFMNEVLGIGSSAILHYKGIVCSLKFPVTIIPTIEVVALFLKRSLTFILLLILMFGYHYANRFNALLFIYYLVSMLILMFVINLLVSAFVAISSDFAQIFLALTRIVMFTLPILWSFEMTTNQWLLTILKLNPLVYIISGFRDAFYHGLLPSGYETLYFWSIVVMLFVLGSRVQFKLRKYYADFM